MLKRLSALFILLLALLPAAGCAGQKKSAPSGLAELAVSLYEPEESADSEWTEQSEPPIDDDSANNTNSQKPASQKPAVPSSQKPPAASIPPRETVRITIPEGYTVSQIGDLLAAKGICTKKDYMAAVTTVDFGQYYSFVGSIPATAGRCYKLEGYLFPNTYDFYKNMDAADAIGKLLREAQNKLVGKYSHSKLSFDELLTLASIIEKETGNKAEMARVSSVFHNRLNSKMKLQADATINYLERYVKPNLTENVNRYSEFYNTYKCKALPSGPICSPGANALVAAANPADTDYLFFAADKNTGRYYYAATYAEHLDNCRLLGLLSEKPTE